MKFHHVGYAVADIDRYLKDFLLPLFAPARVSPVYEDPIQRVRVLFAEVSPGTLIELVEPLDQGSPVTRFLGDARGGLYHLCYEVADIDAARAWFEGLGKRVLGPTRIGAHGTPIFFLHPKDMGGVLTEIMESPRQAH